MLLFHKLRAQARHLWLCPWVALAAHGQMDQHRRSWICMVSDVPRQESSGGCNPQSKVWCCEVSGDESRSALSLQGNKLQHLPLQSTWLLPQASLPSFCQETMLWISENLGMVGVGPPPHYSSSGRDPKQNFASAGFSVVAASNLHFSRGKHWHVKGFHLHHISGRHHWNLLVHRQAPGWHATERFQHGACHWSQILSSAAAHIRNQPQPGAGVDHTEEPFRRLISRGATDRARLEEQLSTSQTSHEYFSDCCLWTACEHRTRSYSEDQTPYRAGRSGRRSRYFVLRSLVRQSSGSPRCVGHAERLGWCRNRLCSRFFRNCLFQEVLTSCGVCPRLLGHSCFDGEIAKFLGGSERSLRCSRFLRSFRQDQGIGLGSFSTPTWFWSPQLRDCGHCPPAVRGACLMLHHLWANWRWPSVWFGQLLVFLWTWVFCELSVSAVWKSFEEVGHELALHDMFSDPAVGDAVLLLLLLLLLLQASTELQNSSTANPTLV